MGNYWLDEEREDGSGWEHVALADKLTFESLPSIVQGYRLREAAGVKVDWPKVKVNILKLANIIKKDNQHVWLDENGSLHIEACILKQCRKRTEQVV